MKGAQSSGRLQAAVYTSAVERFVLEGESSNWPAVRRIRSCAW